MENMTYSGLLPVVPPTTVTHGQEAGKLVVKPLVVPVVTQVVPTPESPDATRTDTPRAPS